MENVKRVYRSTTDKIIAGVCGGLGEYFSVDPLIFRALFLLFVIAGGFGLLFYIVLAIVIPKAPGAAGSSAPLKENVQQAAAGISESLRKLADDIKRKDGWFADRRNILGLIIIFLGFVVLVNLLFPGSVFSWGIIWPLLIIVIGIVILKKRNN